MTTKGPPAGRGDCEITIDKKEYESLSERQREALMFHELWHVQLKTDKHGGLLYDDHSRPQLKMRLHDHQFGWFDEVAKRYGDDSYEVRQAKNFKSKAGQQWFAWDLGGKTSAKKVTA